MAKRILFLLATILFSIPAPCRGGEADNAAEAMGFVCRVVSTQNVAVISPLSGMFSPESRIRFLDDMGNECATGIVRSSYKDLVYVALDSGSVECLKKGFMAFSGRMEEPARAMCGYSMNLPMVIEKGVRPGHSIPPNVIVINYIENSMKPVHFRHQAHAIGCRTCHHRDLDTPCRQCHPTQQEVTMSGGKMVDFGDCVREKCVGCHKSHEGKSADCAWCHK